MKKIYSISLIILLLISRSGFAGLLPVIDPAEILKTIELIKEAQKQFRQLQDLSKQNKQQYNFLEKNLSGNYGYGKYLNGSNDLKRRQWSNGSWVDVLSASNSGSTSAFSDAQRKYKKLYPVTSAEHISTTRRHDNLTRTHYQQSSEISRAALAASSYSYDQINEHIKNLHDMLAMLENETSEKAAIDVNTRLVAELGFIQIEMLRQQNIQNQLLATQTQGEVNGMSDQSQFMQWHN